MPNDQAKIVGRLKKVDLRYIWEHEALDFTPWLAKPENIELLSETLNIDMEVQAQEQNIGPYRADIVCKDKFEEHLILIENQLEKTDHLHLGQLLTYAAGLQAVTIVWIAKRFTEEHRKALDWLNDVTSERANFYGIEVELWQIGDSLPAPRFNLVSKPNTWSKELNATARTLEQGANSEEARLYTEYWQAFIDYVKERPSQFRVTSPSRRFYQQATFNTSRCALYPNLLKNAPYIKIDLYIRSHLSKPLFAKLIEQRLEIEQEIGSNLEWSELPNKKASVIRFIGSTKVTLEDKSSWPLAFSWYYDSLEKLCSAFKPRIKSALEDLDEPN